MMIKHISHDSQLATYSAQRAAQTEYHHSRVSPFGCSDDIVIYPDSNAIVGFRLD